MKQILINVIAGVVFASSPHCADQQLLAGEKATLPPKDRKVQEMQMFKGLELYSRFDEAKKQWRFAVLAGTNRNKTAEEIEGAFRIVGMDALKREIKRIASGETIFPVEGDWPGTPGGITVDELDTEQMNELAKACASRDITLYRSIGLYAQYDKEADQWVFATVEGMKRIMSDKAVRAAMTHVGVEALKRHLSQYPKGTKISVVPANWDSKPKSISVSPLDQKVIDTILPWCKEKGITLTGISKPE